MPRWTHGEKEIRAALDEAGAAGFAVVPTPHAHGHSWGFIDCGKCQGRLYVWSSPASPSHFASKIRRFVRRHSHEEE
jgi:hypothetical protein